MITPLQLKEIFQIIITEYQQANDKNFNEQEINSVISDFYWFVDEYNENKIKKLIKRVT